MLIKSEETLPEVVKEGKQHHTGEHSEIILNPGVKTGKEEANEGLSEAVSEEIAKSNIDNEPENDF